jgi:predicted transport protein
MSRFGMYSEGPKLSIEEHTSKMNDSIKEIFLELRAFTLSLGPNVVEEVRPHRIVYGKSIILRSFLDIQPLDETLIISLKTESRGTGREIPLNRREQLSEIKDLISNAYTKI